MANEKEDKDVSVPGSLDKPVAMISQEVLDQLVKRSELAELKKEILDQSVKQSELAELQKEQAAVSSPKPHRSVNTQSRLVRGVR